jgi:hypothetical protein
MLPLLRRLAIVAGAGTLVIGTVGCGSGAPRGVSTDPCARAAVGWCWQAIRAALLDCRVVFVGQTHSLLVGATLKSGRKLVAREPRIDEIFDLLREAHCPGPLSVATE